MGVGKVPDETEGSCKQAEKVTMTTLWVAFTRHRHTDNLSEETHRCSPRKTSKGEGAGGKAAKATACEGNVSKMIDLCKSAVKLLKPKTASHMFSHI